MTPVLVDEHSALSDGDFAAAKTPVVLLVVNDAELARSHAVDGVGGNYREPSFFVRLNGGGMILGRMPNLKCHATG